MNHRDSLTDRIFFAVMVYLAHFAAWVHEKIERWR